MIYQPRSIQPTWKSIDANQNAKISMIANTNKYISSYKLTIYNMDNTIKYQGNIENFPNPVYNGDVCFIDIPTSSLDNGENYKWIARLYQPTPDMLITYGNVINPTTYTYTVGNTGLLQGQYCILLDDYAYVFDTIKNLNNNDSISFDSSDQTVTLILSSSSSEYYLPTTKITLGNFATLNVSQTNTTYTYTVGSDGLDAGDYCFTIDNKYYWFTTLSYLNSGDSISYDSQTNKITQTHIQSGGNIVLSLTYISGMPLSFTKSENTNSNIYLKRNINIKNGMSIKIGNEEKTISEYNVNTGLAIVTSPFISTPTNEDTYYIYSDFIETAPENVLYVRETPTLSILGGENTLTTKSSSFTGVYSQSDDVPLVYFIWNLFSINGDALNLLKTSGKIYNANITFSYDGFKNGETYVLTLVCENEFGISVSDQITFNVNYDEVIYNEQPIAEQTNEQGIRVSWTTTIPTEPYSEYIKNAFGYIQSSSNTRSVIWLETNQVIYPNSKIIVGTTESEGIIGSYDSNTGYTVLSSPLNYVPSNGDYYYILSEPDYNLNGVNILYNTPYDNVNSIQLKDYHLIYEKESGMAPWTDDYQLTMQFMLDKDFFYGDTNVYQDIAMIARYEGSENNGSEDLIFFARNYDFCAIKPSVEDGNLVEGEITSIESDGSAIYVSNIDIDLSKQKYLCLNETGYITHISNFESETGKITFDKPLPNGITPSVGDMIFLYDTVEASYYNAVNNSFCLQAINTKNPYYDYIWSDSEYWDDSFYWVEGGTQIERAADTWWKVKVTSDSMTIGKGGV